MDPATREPTVTVLVSLYTLAALSTSEPWGGHRRDKMVGQQDDLRYALERDGRTLS